MEGVIETDSLDIQTLKLSREQILCVTSCEFDKRTEKPKLFAQSMPALCNSQQQVEHAR